MQGDQWELVGKAAGAFVPVLALAALATGFFASSTYNEGATVFITTPTSQEETVQFFSVAD